MKRRRAEDQSEDSYDVVEETLKASSYQKDQYERLLKICQEKLDSISKAEYETSLKEALLNVTQDSFYDDLEDMYSEEIDESIKNNKKLSKEIMEFLLAFEVKLATITDRISTYKIDTMTMEGTFQGKRLKFEFEVKHCGGYGDYYFQEFWLNDRRINMQSMIENLKFKYINKDSFILILDFMFRKAFEFEYSFSYQND